MFQLSFLNSGILFIASAAVFPILIYLFAKKKPKQVIFSSLRFIKLVHNQNNKRINLKNILLLIIRILIIILTILAIARPALKGMIFENSLEHPKTAIAVIIDNSYSMDYLVDSRTNLEIAKDHVRKLNELLTSDDKHILLTLDEDWNNLNSDINNGKINLKKLQNIRITPNSSNVESVYNKAVEILEKSHFPNREVYFFTDMQNQTYPTDLKDPLFVIPISEKEDRVNISCKNAISAKQLVNKSVKQTINFDVVNHTSMPQDGVICKLVLNDKTIAEKAIDLKRNQTRAEHFVIDSDKIGWNHGYIEINNERQMYDNRSYFCFKHEKKRTVGVITDLDKLPLPLETILETYTGNDGIVRLIRQAVSFDELITFDAVIVYGKSFDNGLDFLLKKLTVNNRGSLIIIDEMVDNNWKRFLNKEFGVSLKQFMQKKSGEITSINKYSNITKIMDVQRLRNIDFYNYWNIDIERAKSDILMKCNNKPIAISKDNNVVWFFGVDENDFFASSAFPVFAFNSLIYTKSEGYNSNSLVVGSSIISKANHAITPNDTKVPINNKTMILTQLGNYELIGTSETNMLSINLDYRESDFSLVNRQDYDKINWLGSDWKKRILQTRYGFEIWKYLLLAVLVLFVLEMLLVKKEEKLSR